MTPPSGGERSELPEGDVSPPNAGGCNLSLGKGPGALGLTMWVDGEVDTQMEVDPFDTLDLTELGKIVADGVTRSRRRSIMIETYDPPPVVPQQPYDAGTASGGSTE